MQVLSTNIIEVRLFGYVIHFSALLEGWIKFTDELIFLISVLKEWNIVYLKTELMVNTNGVGVEGISSICATSGDFSL